MQNKPKIVIVGGGGHALTVVDVINSTGQFEVSGFVDDDAEAALSELKIPWLGDDSILKDLIVAKVFMHIGVGQIKSASTRRSLFVHARSSGAVLPSIVAQSAHVSPMAKIGDGVLVSHRAIVNISATIGDSCIINSGAIIEHGASIGDHCHIAPGAIVLGDAKVGRGTFVGAGSVIREGVAIGGDMVIGAGQKVMADVL